MLIRIARIEAKMRLRKVTIQPRWINFAECKAARQGQSESPSFDKCVNKSSATPGITDSGVVIAGRKFSKSNAPSLGKVSFSVGRSGSPSNTK